MRNRDQDTYQPGQSRARRQDSRDDEYSRERGRDFGPQYGHYTENDEGDSSVRAGSYDQGRQYGRDRDPRDQSGSTGRFAGYGDFGQGDSGGGRSGWSGQDRYGQSGYGQGNYRPRGGQGSQRGAYGSPGGWSEPSGEGQQYGQGGDYGGSNPGYGYGDQGYGSQGWGNQQSSQRGQHHGKGPKGYQRSDERIKELLSERLREDPEIDPSEVTITVQGGKITLEGTVDSRQAKNAIEEAADQFGASDVQNNLRVQRSGQQGKQGKSGASGDEGTGRAKQH